MTRFACLVVLVTITAAAGTARAERLTIAVSTQDVKISSNFTGTEITLFGVIERDQPAPAPVDDYGVAVVLMGPPETVVARRKDRVLGVWANRASETITAAPAFYSLSTSVAVDVLSTGATLGLLQLGFDNIGFTYRARATVNDPGAAEFREAYIRLKQRAGLFSQQVGVDFIGDTIFRTTANLPANIPVGRYSVLVYLFSDQVLIAHAEAVIEVSKTGFEQAMTAFARGQSLIYGLASVGLALFVGWLGGVIFRRD